MTIKWEPPSKEELAARGIVEAGDAPAPVTEKPSEAPAKKPRRKKE